MSIPEVISGERVHRQTLWAKAMFIPLDNAEFALHNVITCISLGVAINR